MRVGLFFLPTLHPGLSAADAYRDLIDDAQLAEALGFDAVWIAEHHFDAYGGVVPSPAVLAAALAQRTSRIRIGVAVAVVPFYQPIRLAEEFAMVDVLSQGRLEMGLGRGFMTHEMRGFGVSPDRRGDAFRHGALQLRSAWGEGRLCQGVDGGNSVIVDVTPRPMQLPHPPIWIAASTTQESFEFAGMSGFHLMINPYNRTDEEIAQGLEWYRAARESAGLGPTGHRVLAHIPLYVSTSMTCAYEEPRPHLLEYMAAAETAFARGSDSPPKLTRRSYDDLFASRLAFGTPDRIVRALETWRERGVTDVCFMARFGRLDRQRLETSLRLFASEVLHHVAC
jgi:natural product biosynthesis luciferase-like monooxygenase protein